MDGRIYSSIVLKEGGKGVLIAESRDIVDRSVLINFSASLSVTLVM